MPPFRILSLLNLVIESETDGQARTQSLIGIAVAIGGNVLISLALNCQKLAHKRLELQKQDLSGFGTAGKGSHGIVDSEELSLAEERPTNETRLLINDRRGSYTTPHETETRARPKLVIPRDVTFPRRRSGLGSSPITVEQQSEDIFEVEIDVGSVQDAQVTHPIGETTSEEEADTDTELGNETEYLRSKLWWFGFMLMNIGEFGNFLSYAYAPASVVAPLGTVALIANCIFAPLMLKEKLRKRDLLGVVLAIFGAVTIVGAGKSSDVRLDPAGLIRAISRRPFVIYAILCAVLIIVFGILSAGPAGRKWVFVDVGLCALFGGFTVLATKAVSTLLSLHWIDIFKDWITYPIVAVLAITGVGQIKYLNRALMKFDSKVVIPTFFVSFNLSAIVGSAILYGDFENVQVHQFTTFLYGCATTFLGVFFLTRSTGETGVALEQEVVLPEGAEQRSGGQSSGCGTRPTLPLHLTPSQSRETPVLRTQKSSASLVLSPGQYLLLATSPPRERAGNVERPTSLRNNSSNVGSPGSISRRRTLLK